jgi:hypothetical protein
MCTISVVPSPDSGAVRILMNRDERRLRPAAHPPSVHQTGTGQAIWPVDPEGGGTWNACTDAGLALMLLNTNGVRRPPQCSSRGLVIPYLAGARSIDGLRRLWEGLDVTPFAPFRLVAVSGDQLAIFTPTERIPTMMRLGRAHIFASSALGDAGAESTRAELFARMLQSEVEPWAAQTRFHQHAWPDRRHLSVMMSRVEACTVSQTEVVLTRGSVSLAYRPVVDGWPVTTTARALGVKPAVSRAA